MNDKGVMEIIDKMWIFLQRVYMIIAIVTIILAVVNSVLLANDVQETYRFRGRK